MSSDTQELIKQVESLRQFWKLLLPEIAPPESASIVSWLNRASPEVVQAAMHDAARKRANVQRLEGRAMAAEELHRYTTSCIAWVRNCKKADAAEAPNKKSGGRRR